MSTTTTDPIADMLTRIRNAIAVNKTAVVLPHSQIKSTVAGVLADNHFVQKVEVVDPSAKEKLLRIVINNEDENARITHIERMSTPGRRLYIKADAIPTVKNGRGIVIVSTSQGVMTGDQARDKRLGGELICKVY